MQGDARSNTSLAAFDSTFLIYFHVIFTDLNIFNMHAYLSLWLTDFDQDGAKMLEKLLSKYKNVIGLLHEYSSPTGTRIHGAVR